MTLLRLLSIITCFGLLTVAVVGGEQAGITEIMVDSEGYAIRGYDPVVYFTEGRAGKGNTGISARWRNAAWLFVSTENRDLFLRDPEKYAPAYGGWCAYGMAKGYAAETDPLRAWTIYQDRLYLNWDQSVAGKWSKKIDAYLDKSERNWPEVRNGLAAGTARIHRK